MPRITWTFKINGTGIGLYDDYGLKFNPFPQHATAHLDAADLALQSLAQPNMNPEEIEKRLKPYFSGDFIASVLKRYQPDALVECTVKCEWQP